MTDTSTPEHYSDAETESNEDESSLNATLLLSNDLTEELMKRLKQTEQNQQCTVDQVIESKSKCAQPQEHIKNSIIASHPSPPAGPSSSQESQTLKAAATHCLPPVSAAGQYIKPLGLTAAATHCLSPVSVSCQYLTSPESTAAATHCLPPVSAAGQYGTPLGSTAAATHYLPPVSAAGQYLRSSESTAAATHCLPPVSAAGQYVTPLGSIAAATHCWPPVSAAGQYGTPLGSTAAATHYLPPVSAAGQYLRSSESTAAATHCLPPVSAAGQYVTPLGSIAAATHCLPPVSAAGQYVTPLGSMTAAIHCLTPVSAAGQYITPLESTAAATHCFPPVSAAGQYLRSPESTAAATHCLPPVSAAGQYITPPAPTAAVTHCFNFQTAAPAESNISLPIAAQATYSSMPIATDTTYSPRHMPSAAPNLCAVHANVQNHPYGSVPMYSIQNNNVYGAATDSTYNSSSYHVNNNGLYSQLIPSHAIRKLYDLPDFSGRPEEWPVLIATFRESSLAYGYTNLENTFRLQKCLRGAAREDVESLLISPQNVLSIIDLLEFKYGQPELLIKSQLLKTREIPIIPESHLERLVPFATKVQNLTAYLKNANAIQHLGNPTLLQELISKMPLTKRIEWTSYATQIKPYPTLEHFTDWINQVARVISKATICMQLTTPTAARAQTFVQRGSTKPFITLIEETSNKETKIFACYECKGNHPITQCDKFLKNDTDKKWETVKVNKLCFSCLSKGHTVYQCRRKRVCQVNECKKIHHPALHPKNDDHANIEQHNLNTVQETSLSSKPKKLLFKVLPVELRGINNKVVKIFAFLDEGSSATLLNESVAHELGFKEKMKPLSLSWFGGRSTDVTSMAVNIDIKGVGKNKWYNIHARTVPDLELPKQTVNLGDLTDKHDRLQNFPIVDYMDAKPQLLIGLDNCHLTSSLKSLKCEPTLIAAETPLGWLIYGKPSGAEVSSSNHISIVLHATVKEKNMEDLITDYFTTENFGVSVPKKQLESKEVIRSRKILNDTTKRLGERYETGLLWKSDNIILPESYKMAERRLYSIENKMNKDLEFAKAYTAAMENYISKGYARKMSSTEAAVINNRTWYLPHFAVFNVNKPGKLRLVFDAAAQVDGISLNSQLMKGPDENQALNTILFRFREKSIGLCADIKEMYLRVQITKPDQESQRFLWRNNDTQKPVDIYIMEAMIFGATCSPCSAQFVKNKNAVESAPDQPKVIEEIVNNHYVDDFVSSFCSEEEALDIGQAVKNTHLKAGFELRSFISNSESVQNQLNGYASCEQSIVKMDTTDKLYLHKVNPLIVSALKIPTKRELLSLVMSVYDPFGMLANLLIYGKVMLQDVWRSGVNWDEDIPQRIFERFAQWVTKLQLVKQFRLRRCYSPSLLHSDIVVELHVFVDASETAFAAVAYWRIVMADKIEICFIVGKTKCAPLKLLSVPRLELQAAVLGARLKNTILECHRVKISKIVCWSDSRTVLSWIKSDHRQFKSFVAHRVGEILETTHENDWRWVPTKLNPADAATRTVYPVDFVPKNQWVTGPEFLKTTEEFWAISDATHEQTTNEEVRRCLVVTTDKTFIDLTRFSSFLRLKRTIAWVLRFINIKCRKNDHPTKGALTADELNEAERALCRSVQKQIYGKEINDIQSNRIVTKDSKIFTLSPGINKYGVLCVFGRLSYALALPESTRNPAILPSRHSLTELMVKEYHDKYFHQNDEVVVNEIRRKFWIPHLRAVVKRVKSRCQFCKNNRAQPKPTLMGQLPSDRVTPFVRPFTFTGVDYFGPLYVTIGRRREKRWAALFTCMTVRAIHIELAADLSTDACILCIRNFINRRGVPVKIRSDMGTNFVGTDGELRRVNDFLDMNYLQTELSTKGITWEFNCPANPSSGGSWERLIQSTKRVLAVTLKESAPQVETLRSLLIEAENIVNSRPLTHLPVESEDLDPLTPNHFLLGTTNSTQTPGDDNPICTRKQYRIGQQLKNKFWHRWIRDYLPTITRRTKWFTPQKQIQNGDIVLICDENAPRSSWKRGRVISTIKAKDGQIRIADVKTSNGTLRRPVSRLAILDLVGEAPQDLHEGGNVVDQWHP